MTEKEYIIFCDESDKQGKYFSNFYGGVQHRDQHRDWLQALGTLGVTVPTLEVRIYRLRL